jgi:hypothetical protein
MIEKIKSILGRYSAVDSWLIFCLHFKTNDLIASIFKMCKCGKRSDQNLVGALEFRCCHEITEAIGKLTFDGSMEKISCVTLHEDFSALTNETVLLRLAHCWETEKENPIDVGQGLLTKSKCFLESICNFVCLSMFILCSLIQYVLTIPKPIGDMSSLRSITCACFASYDDLAFQNYKYERNIQYTHYAV